MPPLRRVLWIAALSLVRPASAQYFDDATEVSGVSFRHEASKTPRKYLPETMGGGVAILDANLDGLMDLFFVNGARLRFPHQQGVEPDKSAPRFWNRLYLNDGEMRFRDATETYGLQGRGYGMGAAVGDYDGDGDPDLLVTMAGTGGVPAAALYRNDAGRSYADVTAEAGIDVRGWATSAGFFDADNDGDLDLLLLRYMKWSFDTDNRCGMEATHGRSYCHPGLFPAESNVFYRNNGDGTFSDQSEDSGIAAHPGKGLGLAFADYDSDGWTDIAIANDSHPQYLFRNLGDGAFSEEALVAGTAYDDHGNEFAGMGILFEDLDGDGQPDILVTALSQERYALFFNTANGLFDYATGRSGLGAATQLLSGWGVAALDADTDGTTEIFFANGHVMDNIALSQPHVSYRQRPLLLTVSGRRTTDVSEAAGGLFQAEWASRGAAVGDLDNDGRPDLVVSNLDGSPYIARNVSHADRKWLAVRLQGCDDNRDGLGARIALQTESGTTQYRYVTRSGSYLAARDPRAFFGLGEVTGEVRLRVTWPSGASDELEGLAPGKYHTVVEGGGCTVQP